MPCRSGPSLPPRQPTNQPTRHASACREDARFLYKRIPDEIRQSAPELPAAFEVLQRLWVRDYQGVWGVLGGAWSPALQPVARAVGEQQRQHMLRLVGRSYANLSPAKLAALLGASEQEAIQGEARCKAGRAPAFLSPRSAFCHNPALPSPMVGLDAGRVARTLPAAAIEKGWELDGGSGLVVVKQKEGGEGAHATPDHLKRLSQYIVHLEG